MFETLFGAEMPLAVRFFLAFLIVLGLIGAAAWVVRRFGSGRYGGAGQRGRQPRLAVIDHASVDARRRLILIRRDNVEHLLLVGGPTDIVVEPNIIRAVPTARDVPVARVPAAAEPLPRAVPLPDSLSNDSWPLQPEPAAAPSLTPPSRRAPVQDEPAVAPVKQHTDAPARAPRENLTTLADNLAVHSVSQPRMRSAAPGRPQTVEPRFEPRPEQRAAAPAASAEIPSPVDQSLAEMAHRLEAALRKPKTTDVHEASVPPNSPRLTPSPEQPAAADVASTPPTPAAPPRHARVAEARPPRPEAAKEGKALYDSLEQEMASLLGRPGSKP